MAYQVLATKWRPRSFKDIVGQDHVILAIKNSLLRGKLHNVYLFTGTRGVGKTTIARILAKSFNCEHLEKGEPCNRCNSCLQIDKGNFIDLLELDAASNTGVDNIREILDNSLYLPTSGIYKVYIIDEVHMLSKSAFNAMLKTLEDPPSHAKFILATTEVNKIPITILSRCLQFVLYNLNLDQISSRLDYILKEERIKYEYQALSLISRFASGSMRDALSLLDQAIALGDGEIVCSDVRKMLGIVDRRYLFILLKYIHNSDKDNIFKFLKEIFSNGVNFSVILDELSVILQELGLFQLNTNSIDINNDEYDLIKELSDILDAQEIQIYYKCVLEGKKDLHINPDEYSGFMMTILRMLSFVPLYFDCYSNKIYITDDKSKNNLNNFKSKSITNKLDNNFARDAILNKESATNFSNSEIFYKSKLDNLPILSKDNWHEVVYKMGNYLGPIKFYLSYSKLVSLDNRILGLAISEDGKKYAKESTIDKLKDIFKKYYDVNVRILDWEDNYTTIKDLINKEEIIDKKELLDILNKDKNVKKLIDELKLDLDLNSLVRLK